MSASKTPSDFDSTAATGLPSPVSADSRSLHRNTKQRHRAFGATALSMSLIAGSMVGATAASADTAPPVLTPRSGPTGFAYSGSAATFTVPAGVRVLKIEALGGSGASGSGYLTAGAGALVTTYQPVTPGEVLTVRVGGAGYARSAGGAATSVVGSSLVVVAGGGGGSIAASTGGSGAAAGSPAGGNATDGTTQGGFGGNADGKGTGGNGGKSNGGGSIGGTGGSGSNPGTNGVSAAGGGGGGFAGGAGGNYAGTPSGGGTASQFTRQLTEFGGGGGSGFGGGGGASGGGGYGGGGGGSNLAGGGAGGSFATPEAADHPDTIFAPGSNAGPAGRTYGNDGSVTITALQPQKLIKCGSKPSSPKGIKKNRTTVLVKQKCKTNAGQRLSVTASIKPGKRFSLKRKKHGTTITTKSKKFTVTLYWKAPAVGDFAAYSVAKTYKVK